MRKNLFLSGLVVALPMALAAVLILHPTRAKSEDTKASSMEVRVDNFTFGPDTLTVPVNSTVTWAARQALTRTTAAFTRRW